jgi:putative ABC transport system permease protein
MNVFSSFIEALESLTSNKVRSGLTMLGIIIGVAAVIAMMSIGSGAQAAITNQISSIGTNLLYVKSGGDADYPQAITLEDAAAIAEPANAPSVSQVAAVLQGQVEAAVPGIQTNTSLVGVTPEFFQVQKVDVAEGQMISQMHVDDYSAVVLLGSDVATTLFDKTTDLIGEKVRLNGQVFKVIGVLASKGGNGLGNSDDRVLVPLSTARLRLVQRDQSDEVDMLYVQASSADATTSAKEEVSQILRARHRKNLGTDDFDILSTQDLLDTMNQVTGILTAFLGGIAGISLLVGGIGIMNIMLVTVTERTREIGLRKAIGARKADIRVQFIVESAMISLAGGVIGILLGWGISWLIGQIASSLGTSLTPVIKFSSVLMATTFSAAVGLFFGLYPASRAANLQPVEALRGVD